MSRLRHDCIYQTGAIGWVEFILKEMQELRRMGDARVCSFADYMRSLPNGKGPLPHHDCFVDLPFKFPSVKVDRVCVAYVVFQNEYCYTRHAHFVAFGDEGEVIPLAANEWFIRNHYLPLACMLGFEREKLEFSSDAEDPTVAHFIQNVFPY